MNSTLPIESLSESLVSNPTTPLASTEQPARVTLPGWKFGEVFEALLAVASVVYLIGAVSLAGLLLFYTLRR
jgi:hypothetical protein